MHLQNICTMINCVSYTYSTITKFQNEQLSLQSGSAKSMGNPVLTLLLGKVQWFCEYVLECLVLLVALLIAIVPAAMAYFFNRKVFSNLAEIFSFFSKLPFGIDLLSVGLGLTAPYSGSVNPKVRNIEMTERSVSVTVTCEDRQWLRNPFNSMHAVALSNIGEAASGIAALTALSQKKEIIGIPVRIDTEFFKKGRGRMIATSEIPMSEFKEGISVFVSDIRDTKNELIAKCKVTWSLRSRKDKNA